MKILYGIQGTGNGHLSRAEDIVPILKQLADVDVLVSGNQSQVNTQFEIDFQRNGLTFYSSKKGKVDTLKTLRNIGFNKLCSEINNFPIKKYDLVISDFEPISSWAALIKGVPCIELSHQAAVIHPSSPKIQNFDPIGQYIMKHYCPSQLKYGFHFKNYDQTIFEPIIRNSIRKLNPNQKPFFVVYLPAFHDEIIYSVLKHFDIEWRVFSKYTKSNYIRKNVQFFPIDQKKFTESFKDCTGVMCGAGFELPAEAIFLSKKLLVIPLKGQFEQKCNAESLRQMGITVLDDLNLMHYRTIQNWINITSPLHIDFKPNTLEILEQIINVKFHENIPTKEYKNPLINFQFYRLFL
jgi:uncharacterized protein (TIGR00661 family)